MNRVVAGIYVIRLKLDGRVYVGSSANISKRWHEHRRILRRGIHHSQHLQHAWSKYGEDSFEFVIVEEVPTSALYDREQHYFQKHHDKFNCAPVAGSRLGARLRPEALAEQRRRAAENLKPIAHGTRNGYEAERRRGITPCAPCRKASSDRVCAQNHRVGKHSKRGTPEHFEKMSKASIGRTASQATRGKMSATHLRPIAHGTYGGYRQEKSRGLEACAACKKANSKRAMKYYNSKPKIINI